MGQRETAAPMFSAFSITRGNSRTPRTATNCLPFVSQTESRRRQERRREAAKMSLQPPLRLPVPNTGSNRHSHDSVDARTRRHQADAAIPEHHGRRTQKVDDRSVGAPTPVESSRPVASRDGLSVICQSRSKKRLREIFKRGWIKAKGGLPTVASRSTYQRCEGWRVRQDSNLRPPA